MLAAVVFLALFFGVTNGFHDSANAIAALVMTRAARPGFALLLAAACHIAGPLLIGTAVADTVGGIVTPPQSDVLTVLLAALIAAIAWNMFTWYLGLPASSSHALVGALVGAAVAAAGWGSVHWGGFAGGHVVGVIGVLAGLAISPLLGGFGGLGISRLMHAGLGRATRRFVPWVGRGEWVTAGTLAFSHGANDAQKTMGLLALALVANGETSSFVVPLWVKLASAVALTFGTALGGWRIVRTVGRGIYRLTPLDGLTSQTCSTGVILGAAALGAPVSTTHVVSASVVGVGARQRRRHVRWRVTAEIGSAWVLTLPVCGLAAAGVYEIVRWL